VADTQRACARWWGHGSPNAKGPTLWGGGGERGGHGGSGDTITAMQGTGCVRRVALQRPPVAHGACPQTGPLRGLVEDRVFAVDRVFEDLAAGLGRPPPPAIRSIPAAHPWAVLDATGADESSRWAQRLGEEGQTYAMVLLLCVGKSIIKESVDAFLQRDHLSPTRGSAQDRRGFLRTQAFLAVDVDLLRHINVFGNSGTLESRERAVCRKGHVRLVPLIFFPHVQENGLASFHLAGDC